MARGKNGTQTPGTIFQMELPSQAVSFDADSFDEFIRSAGVKFVHWRSMRCPVGMTDPDDIRRPHDHHEHCSNGFLYTLAGEVTCGFLGNNHNVQFMDAGLLNGSSVQIVMPRTYDLDCACSSGAPVHPAAYDRMYLKEENIAVEDWNTFCCSVTGVDKLNFPATEVHDLVDSHGRRYVDGVDFCVKQGKIVWHDGKSPGVDPKTGKGVVCSARFSYRPFWYIKNMIHEVRVAQVEDEYGNRSVERMPQSCMLQREAFFEKEQRDSTIDQTDRMQKRPADGGFGPR